MRKNKLTSKIHIEPIPVRSFLSFSLSPQKAYFFSLTGMFQTQKNGE